jgi:hypothetical protein
MSKLLKGIAYAGLGACLAIKSDVSGMTDTSKPHVDVIGSSQTDLLAKGEVRLSCDFGNIALPPNKDIALSKDNKFTASKDRTFAIPVRESIRAKVQFGEGELRTTSGKVVAHMGIDFGGKEINLDSNEAMIDFIKDKDISATVLVYKEGAKSGNEKFAENEDLPVDWVRNEDNGFLNGGIALRIVAAR